MKTKIIKTTGLLPALVLTDTANGKRTMPRVIEDLVNAVRLNTVGIIGSTEIILSFPPVLKTASSHSFAAIVGRVRSE